MENITNSEISKNQKTLETMKLLLLLNIVPTVANIILPQDIMNKNI